MRKIEQEMVQAINNRQQFDKGNTFVMIDRYNRVTVYLHGNRIAYQGPSGGPLVIDRVTWKRWSTPTTRSRLHALGFDVSIKNGQAMVGGFPA